MEREINKDLIEKQAKEILDKFASSLEKVEKEKGEIDSNVNRDNFERDEDSGKPYDSKFKEKILNNSPNHDDDFIIAETGGWK
jgi:hypothetical protein